MLQNRYFWGGVIILVLFVANIINFIVSGWGLITVQVRDVPLGKVIKSIEGQSWVNIYTNADLSAPISMNVYRVPLAEAMETLAANVPPETTGATAGAGGSGAPGGPGGPRGRRGGGGFGGGFGGAQWKLAFFTAPTSGQVKEEIRAFQSGGEDDETKVYSYPTPLQMLASDSGMPAADPRLQVWPGWKAPPPPPPAAADDSGNNANADPPAPPSTVQDYLNAMAQSADIWIMSPSTWDPKVSSAPSKGSSIADAVRSVVGRAHGSVEQALILTVRMPGRRGGGGGGRGFVGGDTGWSYMQDRMRNAINGLPADARADATNQLNQEVDFRRSVQAAPPEQRGQMMRAHFQGRGMDNWRRSPEMRAQMYSRVVANRQAARGQ